MEDVRTPVVTISCEVASKQDQTIRNTEHAFPAFFSRGSRSVLCLATGVGFSGRFGKHSVNITSTSDKASHECRLELLEVNVQQGDRKEVLTQLLPVYRIRSLVLVVGFLDVDHRPDKEGELLGVFIKVQNLDARPESASEG